MSVQDGGRDVSQSHTHCWCTSSFLSPPQYTHLQHCFPQTALLRVPALPVTLAPQNHDLPAMHTLGKSCWNFWRCGGSS